MIKESSIFWNSTRINKAKNLGLDIYQVSILASIVEKEQTIRNAEWSND